MRRSGLLTVVFALLVGIAVAFGASAAQPQPRAHVYLLRGLFNVFSLGMDSLTEELKRRGVNATAIPTASAKAAVNSPERLMTPSWPTGAGHSG